MKLKSLLLLTFTCVATLGLAAAAIPLPPAAAAAAAVPPDFRGVLTLGQEVLFSLSTPGATHSAWVKLGDTFEGWQVAEFRRAEDTLVLKQGATSVNVRIATGKIGSAAPVETKATLAQAEEVMRKMNFEGMLGKMLEQQKQSVAAMMKQMAGRSGANGVASEEMAAFQNKIMDVMWAEMKPEELKNDVTRIYSETFTAEELRGLSEFYSTSAGQALVNKQPDIQQKMSAAMMPRLMAAMPKIQQMSMEFAQEQKAKRDAAPAPAPAAAP
jgi:hypothetical protein